MGAAVSVEWHVYDGYHAFELERAEARWTGTAPIAGPALERLPADVMVDGRLSLRARLVAVDEDGVVIAERKVPARPFEVVGGELVAVALEASALPPEVEAILPERQRGHRVTEVAVASRRTEPLVPAPILDNADKDFDRTGAPAVRRNVDLLREPPSEDEVRTWLASIGLEDRIEEVLVSLETSFQQKLDAVDAEQGVR